VIKDKVATLITTSPNTVGSPKAAFQPGANFTSAKPSVAA